MQIPLINFLVTRFRRLRLNKWRLEGNERHTGKSLTIIYSGHASAVAFVRELAFGNDYRQQYLGKVWSFQQASLLTPREKNTLYLIEGASPLAQKISKDRSFFIPMWIEGELDIDNALARSKSIGNIKEDLRRIRKNSLEYEVTRDDQMIEDFHRQMYVPYIKNTFGSAALFHSLETLKKSDGTIELLLIKKGDEALAGQILVYEYGGVRTREIGVKNGDRQIVKAGVMGAIYYYGLQHLQSNGYRTVALGGSRAWLNDGVLRFKKKWGMKLSQPWSTGLILFAPETSEGVTAFLANNPFLSIIDGRIEGMYFSSSPEGMSVRDTARIHRDYFFDGMSKVVIYPLTGDPWSADISDDVADEVLQGHYLWHNDNQ